MASEEFYSNVQVLYQLSWEGKLEHPHMITVQYPTDQDGLRLRDVKKRLTALRGQGIGHSFSWSYKRNYKSTFIWNDLTDDDLIHPLPGSGEYVLKASELIDAFATKATENRTETYQKERRHSTFTSQISKQAVHRHSRTMSVEKLALVAESTGNFRKDESTKGVAIDNPQSLPPLSVEQETIDVEKSDFCLSSSDNEISPRPTKMEDSKCLALVVKTRSPTVQGLQTPPSHSRLPSPTDAPCSPGSVKRLWKREIRKSLFGTRNTNVRPLLEKHHEVASENATSQGEALPIENSHEDASNWRDARSKSVGSEMKEKEVEQSTSQLIRMLWARWTGGSSRGKRIPNSQCEASSTSHPLTPHPVKASEDKANPLPEFCQSHTKPPCKEMTSPTQVDVNEIPQEEAPVRKAAPHSTETPAEGDIAAVDTPSQKVSQSDTQRLEIENAYLGSPDLQIVLESPTTDTQGGPPEAEVETPKPAIARADFKSGKNSNGLPRVKTKVSPKSLPPGFHKGTNDTKPVQTPRSSFRSSIPLASPPLRRSLTSSDANRSFREIGAITGSPDEDSTASTPSPHSKAIHEIKKCINFSERDERPLIPGVTTLDWEKALQEAAIDCLPPPNFREILQECSTCGRRFKPDSLLVHMRGCHQAQYARAFSLRASPHNVLRSRVP